MKKGISFLPVLLLLLGLGALQSCQQPTVSTSVSSSNSSGGSVTFVAKTSALPSASSAVSASVSSKSIVPSGVSFSSATFYLYLATSSAGLTSATPITSSSSSINVGTLAAGTWYYLLNMVSGTTVIGTATGSFAVGSTATTVAVTLGVPTSGTGSFSLSLSWPTGYSATVSLINSSSTSIGLASATTSATTYAISLSSLPSGCYTLSLTLKSSSSSLAAWGDVQSVYIYSGQTTSASYTLTSTDLNKPSAVTGLAARCVEISTGSTPTAASFHPQLSWTAVSGATGYQVCYSTNGTSWSTATTLTPTEGTVYTTIPCYSSSSVITSFPTGVVYNSGSSTTLTYTDTVNSCGTTNLQYKVMAVNAFGTSDEVRISKPAMPTNWYVASGGTGDGSSSDTPTGDLQLAIDGASTNNSVVYVAAGTYLPTSWPQISNPSFQTDRYRHFALRSNVKVIGAGAGNTILSGGMVTSGVPASTNLYHVVYNPTALSASTLQGVTITGGCANDTSNYSQGAGGGMILGCDITNISYSWTGDLTIQDCVFVNNYACQDGGGLLVLGGTSSPTLKLKGTRFISNTAAGAYSGSGLGGGLCMTGKMETVPIIVDITGSNSGTTNSDFYGNLAKGSSAGQGGAVFFSKVIGSVTSSSYYQNVANGSSASGGGAVCLLQSGTLNFSACTFDSNTSAGYAGAIYCVPTPAAVTPVLNINTVTKFTGNSGSTGGALYVSGVTGTINTCTFDGNTAASTQFGGAINSNNSALSYQSVIFKNNQAGYGGAIHLVTDTGSSFQSCEFQTNHAKNGTNYGSGGAVSIESGKPEFIESYFDSNDSYEGGAAVILNENVTDLLHFVRCRFLKNQVISSSFTYGSGDHQNGGAVSLYNGSSAVFVSCLFAENAFTSDTSRLGSAIFVGHNNVSSQTGNVALVRCTVANNGSSGDSPPRQANQVYRDGPIPPLYLHSVLYGVTNTTHLGLSIINDLSITVTGSYGLNNSGGSLGDGIDYFLDTNGNNKICCSIVHSSSYDTFCYEDANFSYALPNPPYYSILTNGTLIFTFSSSTWNQSTGSATGSEVTDFTGSSMKGYGYDWGAYENQ